MADFEPMDSMVLDEIDKGGVAYWAEVGQVGKADKHGKHHGEGGK